MTLPVGQISLNQVNVELGLSGTTTISLNQSNVRTLAGVPSGQISMQNLQGKSNRATATYTYSANTANASLNITTLSGYSAGNTDVTITVNSGIYIYATSTANAGLTLTGGTTGDTVTLVNNGYIMGMGGTGGSGYSASPKVAPTVGGPALSLGYPTTVNNTNPSAYIGGGGGGGGSSGVTGAGGGAGGGPGGRTQNDYGPVAPGGAGGGVGSSGSNGTGFVSTSYVLKSGPTTLYLGAGGGGGRIFPGTGGAGGNGPPWTGAQTVGRGGGSGGGGGGDIESTGENMSTAGAGGSANANGGNFALGRSSGAAAGGGGWGATGGNAFNYSPTYSQAGAAGGKAVALNGKTITWTSGNTTRVYGSVS